ncbi:hypothetical protein PRUPE_1G437700 [Prunus persica]|uniref:Uncharacterized protein n=1 Tax=Prunus persica TaxID=3760 RepID=A0A251RC83_PRUPE|nr:hypothetical protein PRUPE_1G437700 [Prunus persica]
MLPLLNAVERNLTVDYQRGFFFYFLLPPSISLLSSIQRKIGEEETETEAERSSVWFSGKMMAANSKLSYESSFQQCLVEENRKKMEALNLPQIALQAHRSPVSQNPAPLSLFFTYLSQSTCLPQNLVQDSSHPTLLSFVFSLSQAMALKIVFLSWVLLGL